MMYVSICMHVSYDVEEATKEKLEKKAKKPTRKAEFRESGVWGDYWRHLNRGRRARVGRDVLFVRFRVANSHLLIHGEGTTRA